MLAPLYSTRIVDHEAFQVQHAEQLAVLHRHAINRHAVTQPLRILAIHAGIAFAFLLADQAALGAMPVDEHRDLQFRTDVPWPHTAHPALRGRRHRPAGTSVTITMRRLACAISCSNVCRNATGSGRQLIASAGTAKAGSASGRSCARRGNGNRRRARRPGVFIRVLRSVMSPSSQTMPGAPTASAFRHLVKAPDSLASMRRELQCCPGLAAKAGCHMRHPRPSGYPRDLSTTTGWFIHERHHTGRA